MKNDRSFSQSASISGCERYRYALERRIPDVVGPNLCWLMLNPSTADAAKDDPTIRKVMGFTGRNGYGVALVVNLFALRETHPKNVYFERRRLCVGRSAVGQRTGRHRPRMALRASARGTDQAPLSRQDKERRPSASAHAVLRRAPAGPVRADDGTKPVHAPGGRHPKHPRCRGKAGVTQWV